MGADNLRRGLSSATITEAGVDQGRRASCGFPWSAPVSFFGPGPMEVT
jgi:hypothetical protein